MVGRIGLISRVLHEHVMKHPCRFLLLLACIAVTLTTCKSELHAAAGVVPQPSSSAKRNANATPATDCPLCLGLFGNSSLLDGEFLRPYADTIMRNHSDEHPPTLSGTFRGERVNECVRVRARATCNSNSSP